MGLLSTTTYRYECDRCGDKQDDGTATLPTDARARAEKQGWTFSEWTLLNKAGKALPRQICFCQGCVTELIKEETRKEKS